ncbi:hypothetical protein PRELSG_0025900 [Plasmodium relictum]|uniref:Early transcribed membrane protein n=1 Tax=Plasmodium relictum TaxID=85471 RepID=A0A1J1GK61_PLARL|nr:hypothetical protein PRELSG_0025900 [Plasmodium relictum]CRG84711.1 hypothetical protein PRELSG_0025900 [Plasmodium relictum]
MRFSKIFSFFAFILSIKLLNRCHCDVGEGGVVDTTVSGPGFHNPSGTSSEENILAQVTEDLERKRAKEKIIFITSLVAGLLALAGTVVGVGVYASKRNKGNNPEDPQKKEEEKTEGGEEEHK